MTRHVNVGQDFDAKIKVLESKRKWRVENTRAKLALGFLGLAAVFISGAGVYGVVEGGEFGKLSVVWAALAAPVGAVLHYYFDGGVNGNRNKDGGSSNSEEN